MSEKDELTLKEALHLAAQLCSNLESPTNRDEQVEQLFELATSIQAKYADLTPYYLSGNTLPGKSFSITEEQHQKRLSEIDELKKSLR
ncbi:hypothetical protein M3703_04155 [Mannheimia haemolytica]|uniref:hypothetical protein n=1 Tax=Mannheimia haemolytica TaxID=75985 RepID=UPI00201BBB06|nr:hypothetical protein [Mannheimia haemolytica]MDW0618456.1 hypothetical protein [Mannheimia haemolytica]UQX68854.1 hypothetical protein M3705_07510 [Mannheimia haemolytica]UQX80517.1 hypothetical protein M3703_04155 [Mannheimia haemolytica]HDL1262045.1 hypothetical protein [Mannheimia haemolytica]